MPQPKKSIYSQIISIFVKSVDLFWSILSVNQYMFQVWADILLYKNIYAVKKIKIYFS